MLGWGNALCCWRKSGAIWKWVSVILPGSRLEKHGGWSTVRNSAYAEDKSGLWSDTAALEGKERNFEMEIETLLCDWLGNFFSDGRLSVSIRSWMTACFFFFACYHGVLLLLFLRGFGKGCRDSLVCNKYPGVEEGCPHYGNCCIGLLWGQTWII